MSLFAATLAVALVLAVARYLVLARKVSPGDPVGPVNWSFTDSWASTMTEVGALLGTVLAAQTVAEDATPLSSSDFVGFSLFFGALALFAPLVYKALSKIIPAEDEDKDEEVPSYQGYVWSFLFASFFTLWGVFGQLSTLAMLLFELKGKFTAESHTTVFCLLIAAIALVVLVYAWRTMRAVILYNTTREESASEMADAEKGITPTLRTRRRRWVLL